MSTRDLEGWRAQADALRSKGPETRALINGEYTWSHKGRTFERISPVDGQPLGDIAACDAEDVDRAVRCAREAFEDRRWSGLEPQERKRIMLRFAELIREDLEHLALLETLDMGKPIGESLRIDVPFCADCIAYYAECADKLYDEIAPTGPQDQALIVREALGVVAAIVPWNYPLILAAWKLGPALLVGNSVLLKPAEQSSLSAIRLGHLAREAGIPAGVVQVVTGHGGEAGKALALHDDVDMLAFTGSTEVGKLLLTYAGQSNMKRVSLECGGKSPHIVMDDCPDLDAAASAVAWGIFYNQGETCHAGSRLLVHESIAQDFHRRVIECSKDIALGHPLDPNTWIGALVDEGHMERVLEYIELGQREGATLAMGGQRAQIDLGGYYVEATLLTGAHNQMRIAQEEIFGPVLTSISFATEAEALALANDTIYGLAAAVWTSDLNRAHRMTRGLRAGTVWLNCFDKSSLATPFGGFKQSGFGRDRSLRAIEKYTGLKTIWSHHPR